jgi:hypothetical protein
MSPKPAVTFTQRAGGEGFVYQPAGTVPDPNPVPTLTSILPNSVAAGTQAFTMIVNGTGFFSGSVVNWNGSPRTTTLVSDKQLTAAITAADVAAAGAVAVTVSNPAPGGGTSKISRFTITP